VPKHLSEEIGSVGSKTLSTLVDNNNRLYVVC